MTLDTNIIIAYLNGEQEVIATLTDWKREGRPLFVSTITVSEVLALPQLTPHDIEKIKTFLAAFIIIPFDTTIAERTALLHRLYRLPLPDGGIAATALEYHVPLVTRDRAFQKIKELTVVAI